MPLNTNRRSLLVTTGAIIAGAGCLSTSSSDYVDIVVENSDSETAIHRTVVSTAGVPSGNFSPCADAAHIWSDSDSGPTTVTFKDMVPKLDYNHTFTVEIALNGEMVYTETFEMNHQLDAYQFAITTDGITTDHQASSGD